MTLLKPTQLFLIVLLAQHAAAEGTRAAWTAAPCTVGNIFGTLGAIGGLVAFGVATEGLVSRCDQDDGVKRADTDESRCADAEEDLSTAGTIALWSLGSLGTGVLLHLAFSCSDPPR